MLMAWVPAVGPAACRLAMAALPRCITAVLYPDGSALLLVSMRAASAWARIALSKVLRSFIPWCVTSPAVLEMMLENRVDRYGRRLNHRRAERR